jgi:hypothetical protein
MSISPGRAAATFATVAGLAVACGAVSWDRAFLGGSVVGIAAARAQETEATGIFHGVGVAKATDPVPVSRANASAARPARKRRFFGPATRLRPEERETSEQGNDDPRSNEPASVLGLGWRPILPSIARRPLRRPCRDLPERPFRQPPYASSVGPRKRVQNASTA